MYPLSKNAIRFGAALLILWSTPAFAQTTTESGHVQASGSSVQTGSVSGTVADDTGTGIAAARVELTHDGAPVAAPVATRESGEFSFEHVPAGPFRLTVTAPGFVDRVISVVVAPGAVSQLPPIRMTVAAGAEAVEVRETLTRVAQRQIKEQEQQRVLGVWPNFYVAYNPNAVPLNTAQKFELSWKWHLDPVQIGVVAAVAGVQHRRNDFPSFGGGAEGYAKRFGAAYASIATRSAISEVLLPSVFKQDPRYFYRGTGSTASRVGYALSRTVITKGDNGRWQPNYSGILGEFGAGAVSNLYYPPEDRNGMRLTLQNTAIGLGSAAMGRLAQEFLLKKLTSSRP
jgi:hypothetical protein